MDILTKIENLIKYFKGSRADAVDVAALDNWLSVAKRLLLLKSLAEHDGVKYVLEVFQSEVAAINARLVSEDSTKLSEKQRDRLLDRRELAQKYLDLFLPVDKELEQLEEAVDANNP